MEQLFLRMGYHLKVNNMLTSFPYFGNCKPFIDDKSNALVQMVKCFTAVYVNKVQQ